MLFHKKEIQNKIKNKENNENKESKENKEGEQELCTVDFSKIMEAYEQIITKQFGKTLKADWKYTFVNTAKINNRTLEEQIGRYIALGVIKESQDYYEYTKTRMEKTKQGLPS